jgi:hypothetical protein
VDPFSDRLAQLVSGERDPSAPLQSPNSAFLIIPVVSAGGADWSTVVVAAVVTAAVVPFIQTIVIKAAEVTYDAAGAVVRRLPVVHQPAACPGALHLGPIPSTPQ